ncbi:MAG TPA: MFS transporter [Jatrophihabitantaceae bacterium]|nr:MFS transporter [Jatrophihabitantaceae bacterium]
MLNEPAAALEAPPHLGRASRRSWSLYSRNAICTYLIDGYAPAAVLLGVERGLSDATVGLYSAAMGLGILLGGLIASRLGSLLPRERESWLAIAAACAGIAVLTVGPDLPITLLGMAMIGVSVAVALSSVQSLISDRDGPRGLSEASGFGELFGMLAPFVIALGVLIGLSWRGGLLVVPVAAAVAYLAARGRTTSTHETATAEPGAVGERFSRRSWVAWTCGTLLASAEFTIVLWLPDLLRLNDGLRTAVGTALVSVLLAGMAAGRLLAGGLPLHGNLDRFLIAAVLLAFAGFALLWATSVPALAVIGVIIMGIAMSVHYPIALARLITSAPGATHLASARSAAGQGLAMLSCPPLLGLLSDACGLRWATLVFPAILVGALSAIHFSPVERN